jgi:Tfp pilus assembly protein PilV
MARKFSLHLDALVAMVVVFASAMGFIAYQRHQYQAVAQESMDLQMKQTQLEMQIASLQAIEKKCAAKVP